MYSHARTDSLKLEVILNQTFQVVRVLGDRVKPGLMLLQSREGRNWGILELGKIRSFALLANGLVCTI